MPHGSLAGPHKLLVEVNVGLLAQGAWTGRVGTGPAASRPGSPASLTLPRQLNVTKSPTMYLHPFVSFGLDIAVTCSDLSAARPWEPGRRDRMRLATALKARGLTGSFEDVSNLRSLIMKAASSRQEDPGGVAAQHATPQQGPYAAVYSGLKWKLGLRPPIRPAAFSVWTSNNFRAAEVG